MKENKQFNRGFIKFTFTDEDGDIFASFRMNPTDINLMERAEEVSKYFAGRKNEVPEIASANDLKKYNDEIEDKLNYLLGYDASDELFKEVTATTVSQDGEIFAFVVLDFIVEKLKPEIEKRRQNMQKSVSKYTAKYNS